MASESYQIRLLFATWKTPIRWNVTTHAMRHSYRSWLDAVGTPIAVQHKTHAARGHPNDEERFTVMWSRMRWPFASGKINSFGTQRQVKRQVRFLSH